MSSSLLSYGLKIIYILLECFIQLMCCSRFYVTFIVLYFTMVFILLCKYYVNYICGVFAVTYWHIQLHSQ
jgi:hypothetical protein